MSYVLAKKTIQFCIPPFENSTTLITILLPDERPDLLQAVGVEISDMKGFMKELTD